MRETGAGNCQIGVVSVVMQILYQPVKARAEPESKAFDLAVGLRSYHRP